MNATLIFNPNSGLVNLVTPRQLEEALRAAGYAVDYQPTSGEEDLDEVLEDVEGLVVAAGGDGTVRPIALRLIDRDVKLSILPMGRANNIARSLGIQGNPLAIVDGLRDPRHRRFDVGSVCCPWGEEHFLETFGLGFFADTVAHLEPGEERSLPRVAAALAETLAEYESRPIRMTVDGEDLSGDYTVVEVFNTPQLGPRLQLAPEANPCDGQLHVLRIREGTRAELLGALTSLLIDGVEAPPSVSLIQGKEINIVWDGFPIHVDARQRPLVEEADRRLNSAAESPQERRSMLQVRVLTGAVDLLLPGGATP
jgi:diacylglycerol kinase family enzyme